ncbi:MAG: hypothetical protein IJ692_07945 [Alloprevotella sp.]|nr:hypothetical protein [Alloprevotella sp.]MBR1653298.1 hypothetical protein [Alloprevotella sp.]
MAKETISPQPESRPRRRKGRVMGYLFTFLLGAAAGCGASYYFLLQAQRDDAAEQRAFQALENSNDSADFRAFLERFPDSGYAADVRRRMEQLSAMEEAWRRIAASQNPGDFNTFKSRFHHPYYDKLCDVKVDSIDWKVAVRDSTVASFEHYMAIHPDGIFYAEATFAARQAEKREISDAEREMVISTLDGFMSLLGRGDTETIIGYLPDVMDQFLEKHMATRGDVVLMVEKMFGGDVRECTFSRTGDVEIQKRILAGKPAYSVRTTYTGDISLNGGDGSRHKTYNVKADVGEGHLVRSLTMS